MRFLLVLLITSLASLTEAQQSDRLSQVRDLLKTSVEEEKVIGGAVLVSHRGETHKAMLQQHRIGNIARGGLFIREKDKAGKPTRYGHTGSSGTNVWIDFENDVIGIMLTQTSGKDTKAFRLELEKRVMQAVAAKSK